MNPTTTNVQWSRAANPTSNMIDTNSKNAQNGMQNAPPMQPNYQFYPMGPAPFFPFNPMQGFGGMPQVFSPVPPNMAVPPHMAAPPMNCVMQPPYPHMNPQMNYPKNDNTGLQNVCQQFQSLSVQPKMEKKGSLPPGLPDKNGPKPTQNLPNNAPPQLIQQPITGWPPYQMTYQHVQDPSFMQPFIPHTSSQQNEHQTQIFTQMKPHLKPTNLPGMHAPVKKNANS